MTQDEIIRMAQEAGFVEYELDDGTTNAFDIRYQRFAALVVANLDPKSFISWQEGYEVGMVAEREACAKVCEAGINNATDWDNSYWNQCCENRAAAIRARSQA